MPTIMTHSLVGLASAAVAGGLSRVRTRFWLLSAILPSLPDLDVIGHRRGVVHDLLTGHRGASHSLLVALTTGMAAGAVFFGRRSRRWWMYGLFFSALTAGHGLLDTITNGGEVSHCCGHSARSGFSPVGDPWWFRQSASGGS